MSDLIQTEKTMSSLELTEISGKRHDNVKTDIEKILSNVGIDFLKFQDVSTNHQNQTVVIYRLPKNECLLVTSKWSDQQRWKIIQKLESDEKPLSRLELAKLQVQMIEELENKEAEVKALKVELDESHEWATIKRVEMTTGDEYSWRKLKEVCTELDIPRKDVFDANYGTVKSYHADVWMNAYDVDLNVLENEK